jgi:hypothetical protein
MIKYSNYKLPYGLKYIGDGYTVRKTTTCSGQKTLHFMRALCEHLIARPDPMVVPVYKFQNLSSKVENLYQYSYDMLRLGDLDGNEKEIIWQVGNAWRNGIAKPTRQFTEYGEKVYSVSKAWDTYPELMKYLGKIVKQDRYHDLHGGNIMKDEEGLYKIIDIEGFLNTPLSQPSNHWIKR